MLAKTIYASDDALKNTITNLHKQGIITTTQYAACLRRWQKRKKNPLF